MQNYCMTKALNCTKKIERTLTGLKYQKYFKSQRQHIKVTIKLTLTDQFKQNWQFTVQSSPKALNYRVNKDELKSQRTTFSI